MSEFQFTSKTLDGPQTAIDQLTTLWYNLDTSFNELIKASDPNAQAISDFKVQSNNFFSEFYDSLAKVEAAEESKNNTEEIYNNAVMRPYNLSIGIMLLSVLIYELYSN